MSLILSHVPARNEPEVDVVSVVRRARHSASNTCNPELQAESLKDLSLDAALRVVWYMIPQHVRYHQRDREREPATTRISCVQSRDHRDEVAVLLCVSSGPHGDGVVTSQVKGNSLPVDVLRAARSQTPDLVLSKDLLGRVFVSYRVISKSPEDKEGYVSPGEAVPAAFGKFRPSYLDARTLTPPGQCLTLGNTSLQLAYIVVNTSGDVSTEHHFFCVRVMDFFGQFAEVKHRLNMRGNTRYVEREGTFS